MQSDFKLGRCSRRCHTLDRPLREGEWYFSVVLESGDDYVRRDYSAEAWKGPPEGTLGWWKNRMPVRGEVKLVLAPKELLVDLLREMGELPTKAKARYLLALLLMRRRIVRPVTEPNTSEPEAGGVLRVEVLADGSVIDIPTAEITRAESDSLQEELRELIYCEAAPEE